MGINREQALDCLRSDDLVGIGMEADAVRRRLHPEGVVGYAMVRSVDCGTLAGDARGTVRDCAEEICARIGEAVGMGASGVRLRSGRGWIGRGGFERLEAMLRSIRQEFPGIWIEGLWASEVRSMARGCRLGLRETLARLRGAGLDSIVGEGAELRDGAARGQCGVRDWIEVHRAAHGLEMRTPAAMTFGGGETMEQRVDFLGAVRRLQEETGGFAVFVPVAAAAPGGRELDGVTAVERLKTLAVARMFLDNVEHVQAIGAAQGLKLLQTALRFGADDAGAVAPDGDGAAGGASEEDVRRIIRDAGFRPAQRDAAYRAMMLN